MKDDARSPLRVGRPDAEDSEGSARPWCRAQPQRRACPQRRAHPQRLRGRTRTVACHPRCSPWRTCRRHSPRRGSLRSCGCQGVHVRLPGWKQARTAEAFDKARPQLVESYTTRRFGRRSAWSAWSAATQMCRRWRWSGPSLPPLPCSLGSTGPACGKNRACGTSTAWAAPTLIKLPVRKCAGGGAVC